MDFFGFYTGKIFDAYRYLGAHVEEQGVTFRTFAPGASRITLIGEFNGWQEWEMNRVHDGNFWECYVQNAHPGMMYKYRIYRQDQSYVDHCDPYGYGMELRPNSASYIRDLSSYAFQDDAWMRNRTDCKEQPLNIYEIHFGSFKKPSDKADDWYTYTEMADILIPYLKEYGYNYVEIMPLSEHPCDESWGYQNTGFFSPTSRYGTVEDLMKFVDTCHQNDIGVILDFVPVHFAVDGYALANYDGTALYEYPHQDVGVSEWGSCNFMHSRGEVRSFLQSAANYWLTEYHMDGIRMDAISRIIYWQGEPARGVNHNAVEFIREMNRGLKTMHPTAILSAEDSTSFPNVTKPVSEGGLGFDYKWDMGWMNDTLDYFRTAPEYRSRDYHKLTFSMMYYYNDTFLLPLSHDEVVHGKATILQKMSGDYDMKFPQARAFYMYMYAHPGKKLNFMGNELGQLREWDEKREQDWNILKYPIHDAFHHFMKDLNLIYQTHPALSQKDYTPDGFQWIDCHQEERCIYAFERRSDQERILALFNFSDTQQEKYEFEVKDAKKLTILIASDMEQYAGTKKYKAMNIPVQNGKAILDLEPYSAIYLQVGI
ncbi:1,4-alpha-glucan branching protein GlgB [Bariatricus sp. SGI.161]|uniref:1,4-alpha-glucan branching protein GlgB n=1 Tax=Lachnospiraceae TaxID=186803 RepID=UPI002A7946CE|nr:1,4-alpha-glucan branching protein GlgB [Lachnospiraceae bacterium]